MEKSEIKKIFGTSVRKMRKLFGISQETLAERSDLHRTYISDIERGQRNLSLENITRLAEALEVSVGSLFPPEIQNGKVIGADIHGPETSYVNILLVEDNADDVTLTLHSLKKARFANHVQVVSDGAEALDYLSFQGKYAQRPAVTGSQIVLLDLKLPKVGGIEVLRHIKSDKKMAAIKVIILTGARNDQEIDECRRLGADGYIIKPVDFRGLSEVTPRLNLDWALVQPTASNL